MAVLKDFDQAIGRDGVISMHRSFHNGFIYTTEKLPNAIIFSVPLRSLFFDPNNVALMYTLLIGLFAHIYNSEIAISVAWIYYLPTVMGVIVLDWILLMIIRPKSITVTSDGMVLRGGNPLYSSSDIQKIFIFSGSSINESNGRKDFYTVQVGLNNGIIRQLYGSKSYEYVRAESLIIADYLYVEEVVDCTVSAFEEPYKPVRNLRPKEIVGVFIFILVGLVLFIGFVWLVSPCSFDVC